MSNVAVPVAPAVTAVAGTRRRDDRRVAWLFLLPVLVGFAVFYLYPTVRGVWYSVTDYSLLNQPSFVGADNYAHLATDAQFWNSMKVTLIFMVGTVIVAVGAGLVAALLLNQRFRGRSVVVIGTGINLANHPDDLPQPAVSLGVYGMTITPAEALEVLAKTTHDWLTRWGEGNSFPSIRRAWLDRAGPTGRPLRAKINGEETEGVYGGLDADGALRLLTPDGSEHRISAGDVFFLSR